MQLRVARHTNRLEELVSFYREGLGLPEIGRFDDHDGYSGVFLAIPGTDAHLEFTSGGGHRPPDPHPESLLVLYLDSEEAVAQICERIGADPVEPANPYWQRHGFTFADPDGFRVVLVMTGFSLDKRRTIDNARKLGKSPAAGTSEASTRDRNSTNSELSRSSTAHFSATTRTADERRPLYRQAPRSRNASADGTK